MIEQVLEEIKNAEALAREKRAEADNYALDKSRSAEKQSEAMLKDAEDKVKAIKAEAKVAMREQTDALYNQIITAANDHAQGLYGNLSDKKKLLADDIIKKVLNGDC